jgi:hypothetical protein
LDRIGLNKPTSHASFNTFNLTTVTTARTTEQVVMQGSFRYAEGVECEIRIVRTNTRFGSGDYQDPPEISEDKEIDSYYVQYGSTTERGVFNAGSEAFSTLEEAAAGAVQQLGAQRAIRWQEGSE